MLNLLFKIIVGLFYELIRKGETFHEIYIE